MAGAIELNVDGTPSGSRVPTGDVLGISKLEVAHYVLAVGLGLLAALKDRPVTMECWPQGWSETAKISIRQDNSGDAFYQKKASTRGGRISCKWQRLPTRQAELTPSVKTSGSLGLHSYAPIRPTNFIDARHATIASLRASSSVRSVPRTGVSARSPLPACRRGHRVVGTYTRLARDPGASAESVDYCGSGLPPDVRSKPARRSVQTAGSSP